MFEIKEKKQLNSNTISMCVFAPWITRSAKAGQFVIVIDNVKGERVPLTICDMSLEEQTITIVFQVIGYSTEQMSKMKVGDSFTDIVGPLGRECDFYNIDDSKMKDKHYLFVGGGLGTAPVYPQVKYFKQKGYMADVILGAKTKEAVIMEEEFKSVASNLYICTDDGSYGTKGLVTDKIKQLITQKGKHYDTVVAIGPMIMMKFVSMLTKEYNIPTIVSLNSLMVDGSGMCGACRVTIDGKTKFTCVDGPEFDAHKVDFNEAIQRQSMYRIQEIARDTDNHKCNLTPLVQQSQSLIQSIESKKRVPVREQAPEQRNKNFNEVCFGYNEKEAMAEASRCLNCKNPQCVGSCPVGIKIPQFIQEVKKGDFSKAFEILSQDTALPAVCGRVCPQETQCEGTCVLGKKFEAISIGKLERFVADWARKNDIHSDNKASQNDKKVAIVGSGPSGLTAAKDLAMLGYEVTVFESLHKNGGVLVYGIPEFRLPKQEVVAYEVNNVKRLGVKFINDVIVGKSISIDSLFEQEGFSAVYIASGAGLPKFMGIKGENLNGVLSANELLTRANLMQAYQKGYATPIFVGKKTVVVGGGNVTMDAARVAKRLGSDVYIVYRRSEKEMPARAEEVHHAKEEGIHFNTMTNPVQILSNDKGWVKAIKCVRMELGEPDSSGRRKPIEIEGSEFEIQTDCVVMALGTSPNPLLVNTTANLSADKRGCIITDQDLATTRQGVFAGGDAAIGAATVILAMGAGKKAAKAIHSYLSQKK
jgi:glutamate synthase (NADPH), homotetrameric